MKKFAATLSLALSVACSAFADDLVAKSQVSPAPSKGMSKGAFSHDGFYMSNAVGFGYSEFKNDDEETSMTANGVGFSLMHKLGYTVLPNLIVHANLTTVFYSHLDMERDALAVYAKRFPNLKSVRLGVGATYYLPDFGDLFVGGSAGMIGYFIDVPKMSGSTGPEGYGFSLEVGREFWVSENWGLGLAFVYNSGALNDRVDGRFNSSSIHLMLTATYN